MVAAARRTYRKKLRPRDLDPTRTTLAGSGGDPGPPADAVLMPYRLDWPAWGVADTVSGMTFTRTQVSSTLGGGRAEQASTADADNGDFFEYLFDVDAGTYSFTMIYDRDSNQGIVDVLIDGVSIGTIDTYLSGWAPNTVATISSVGISQGPHTLKLLINGKNASSSDYRMAISWLSLTRTGA